MMVMVTCKIFVHGDYLGQTSFQAAPHAGEYIWFPDAQGMERAYYIVETVIYGHGGMEVEILAKPTLRPPFHRL
jgi:hypothetical protein